MGIGETITVINRSGKVVSSSKHLVNVFKEAKSAYRERKAEIHAERNAAHQEKKLRDGVKSLRIEDDIRSRTSSRHSKTPHRSRSHHRHPKPSIERGYSDSFYANDGSPRHSPTHRRFDQDLAGDARDGYRRELTRRYTDMPVEEYMLRETSSRSESHIDMDLAYGELPPPLPVRKYDDSELQAKASKLTMLLEEANCLQYSVTTIIENLQKNPEALAAVALTLAEISNIAGKMGPGILAGLKGSFPAVVALLASPQFMIAAGVGVGVTIVALGGYKIIKKIQAQKEDEERVMEAPYEMDELQSQELSRIEIWRRGIADAEADSAGTSVDGEFITPGASQHLVAAGVLDEEELKSRRNSRIKDEGERRPKSHRAKSVKSSKSTASRSKTAKESSKKKKKEPSGLKMLFRSHTHS
ncbi:uncharacterized protein BDR25DRAFT_298675 [Lindgomyces ingoldianus]|uniref:Uncharacterized protein n=1 Tax=Lindgomyces ingoldianus TaxID=673940 RepID=A0ACB6QAG7_9PLEO|nr:uncharacterized protein BDR25DRAFT_298675 [Lindgomyces ingoldianus]KAF2463117.1 hypothetical protein BDR25DRAFT_298675 [Lindgomyces ingoldianus]